MRALSNARSPISMDMSPSPRRFSTPISSKRSPSPSPPRLENVIGRLYGRASPMAERGRERREEIDTKRAVSNPRHPPKGKASISSMRHSRSSSSLKSCNSNSSFNASSNPKEVSDRLYNRSSQMQQRGRERREQVRENRIPPYLE